jgi:hypothetical protein
MSTIAIILFCVILIGLVRIARALAQICALLRASLPPNTNGRQPSRRDNVIEFKSRRADDAA